MLFLDILKITHRQINIYCQIIWLKYGKPSAGKFNECFSHIWWHPPCFWYSQSFLIPCYSYRVDTNHLAQILFPLESHFLEHYSERAKIINNCWYLKICRTNIYVVICRKFWWSIANLVLQSPREFTLENPITIFSFNIDNLVADLLA